MRLFRMAGSFVFWIAFSLLVLIGGALLLPWLLAEAFASPPVLRPHAP